MPRADQDLEGDVLDIPEDTPGLDEEGLPEGRAAETEDREALPFESDLPAGIESDKPEEEKYSEKVQRRIDKEVRKRHEEERGRQDAEAKLAAVLKENEELRAGAAKKDIEDLERRKDKLSKKRAKLMGEIDIEDPEEHQKKLGEIEDELADVRYDLTARKRQQQEQPPRRQGREEPQPQPNHAMQAWLEKNGSWYTQGSPKHNADAAKLADEIFYAMKGQGMSEENPAFYQELNKRLQARYKLTGRGNTVSGSPGEEGPDGRGSRGGLTREDFDLMRETNLDPAKPADRAKYMERIGMKSRY